MSLAVVGALAPAVSPVSAVVAEDTHVRSAGPGVDLVSLTKNDRFRYRQGALSRPVMSSDGHHVAWVYNNSHEGHYGDYGVVWRDLTTGRTLSYDGDYPFGTGFYPYFLDLSGSGRFAAFAVASKADSSGQVTAMRVGLWDTTTNRMKTINRRQAGQRTDDGLVSGVRVSDDGRYVVFSSTSPGLMPDGYRACSWQFDADCPIDAGYLYLYDRVERTITPVPAQARYPHTPRLTRPVVSADGGVVAFHAGDDIELWYPASGVVRRLTSGVIDCTSLGNDDLSLSADGTTLAQTCFGVWVVSLGEDQGDDQLVRKIGDTQPYIPGLALSADGGTVVYFGKAGPAGWGQWPVYRASVVTGAAQLLAVPGVVQGLRPDSAHGSGMALNRVTVSADGTHVALVACSIEPSRRRSQTCPKRMDVYRWSFD